MKFFKKVGVLSAALLGAQVSTLVNAQQADFGEVTELPKLVVEEAHENNVSHTIRKMDALEIQRLSISNIEDTTRYIPGVQVNDGGNRFGDDGFNIRGLEGDAVAVTVDGVSLGETLNPPDFAPYGMYGSTRGQTELEHVKAVTITKGPSAVVNGGSALAGSVAYTTLSASDLLQTVEGNTYFGIETGFDSRSDELMVSAKLANRSGRLESMLLYTLRDGDEMKSHDSGIDIVGANRGQADPFSIESDAILAKFAYQLSDTQRLGVVYDSVDRTADGTPLSRNSSEAYPSSYDNFQTLDENNKERYGVFYELSGLDSALFDNLIVAYDLQELFSSGLTAFEYSAGGETYLRQEDRSFTQESDSFTVDFSKGLEGAVPQTLSYGFAWVTKEVSNDLYDRRFNGVTVDTGSRDGYPFRDPNWIPDTEAETLTVYVSDEIQLNDKLGLTAGARYDSTSYSPRINESFADTSGDIVKDASFDAFAVELILDYEFVDGHSLLASVSQGLKAPTVQDLYLNTNGSASIVDLYTGREFVDLDTVANADLESEESTSFELGYKLETSKASLTVTGYHTEYSNMIQNVSLFRDYGAEVTSMVCSRFGCSTSVVTGDDYYQPQNVGKVDVNGIEVDAVYAFTDNLYTKLTYATIDGEYKDALVNDHNVGDKLETAAPDSATLSLGFNSQENDYGVALHAVWFDKVDVSNDLSFTSLNNGSGPAYYPDSYTVMDLSAFYRVNDRLSLTAAAYNVFDKNYFRWEVVNSVRNGAGGFFGGVAEQGYQRYSEPGRSFSVNLKYQF